MIAAPSLDAAPGAGREQAWMWAPPMAPQIPTSGSYWDVPLANERNASSHSPSRYLMYHADGEHGMLPAAQPHAAAPFFPPAAAPVYAFGAPVNMGLPPDVAAMRGVPAGSNFYLPYSHSYPLLDQPHMPMLMQMAPPTFAVPETKPTIPELDADAAAFREEQGGSSLDELLAMSRQAQVDADGGPNAHIFVCPHCDKRYTGKHARSIWRRHLQDKHAIPLSVQPRRTRWDRDANRPRNAAERRERMLESKRRWARKKREQERLAAAKDRSESVSTDALLPDVESAAPRASTPPPAPALQPTPPKRAAFMPRDMNRPRSAHKRDLLKSPGLERSFMPSPAAPVFQATPLRSVWPAALGLPPALRAASQSPAERGVPPSEKRKRGTPLPSSLKKRTHSDRAALASFARVDPSPRVFLASAARDTRLPTESGSPTLRPYRGLRDVRPGGGDQFSSPQNLSLTHSLGLAPHSASKGAPYGGVVTMTPIGASATPFSKMPVGFTPTLGGLLRPGAADTSADLSGYMMGFTALDTAGTGRSAHTTPRRALPSSSERDEDDESDRENDMPNGSPSVRQRPRAKPLTSETPSKLHAPLRGVTSTPLGQRPRTPHSALRLR